MDELVCIEFSLIERDQLIGAADVPAEGWKAAASALGRHPRGMVLLYLHGSPERRARPATEYLAGAGRKTPSHADAAQWP